RGAFRGSLGDNAVPAQFGVRDIGSIWSNYEFTSWNQGFRIEDLFWSSSRDLRSASASATRDPRASSTSSDSRMRGWGSLPARWRSTRRYPTRPSGEVVHPDGNRWPAIRKSMSSGL